MLSLISQAEPPHPTPARQHIACQAFVSMKQRPTLFHPPRERGLLRPPGFAGAVVFLSGGDENG